MLCYMILLKKLNRTTCGSVGVKCGLQVSNMKHKETSVKRSLQTSGLIWTYHVYFCGYVNRIGSYNKLAMNRVGTCVKGSGQGEFWYFSCLEKPNSA